MVKDAMFFRQIKNARWQEEAWKTIDFALNTYVKELYNGEITRAQFDSYVSTVVDMAKNYGITPNIEKMIYDLME
jgi:hypothetical protein